MFLCKTQDVANIFDSVLVVAGLAVPWKLPETVKFGYVWLISALFCLLRENIIICMIMHVYVFTIYILCVVFLFNEIISIVIWSS